MDSRHNVGTNPWNDAAVPVVWSGTHQQRQGTGRRAPETRQAAHCGACGSPGGTTVPAWMTAEQRGCVAV